ncbi:MAG: insulinase family protein, partial [Burkholderiales bacterium]|nr:insulinase family protein [Burkholderiales bacterium]
TVNVSLSLRWGDEKSLEGKRTVAGFARGMLATGTSKYSRAQLADEMSKLKMSGGIYSFQTTKANLPAALELVAHVLKDANYPESEFKQMREQALVGLEASRHDPRAVASNAMGLYFNPYPKDDFRAAHTLDESLAAIRALKLDDVKAYHQQFYGASTGELSIVGDMDVDATKQAIEKAFGHWESKAPYARLVNKMADVPAVRKVFDTPDKENGFYTARMNLALKDTDPDFAALEVANYIFGGGSGLNSRLMERLRQKDGLSYGGGSGLSAGDFDAVGSFTISAIAAPQNVAKVEADVQEELQRAIKDGFTADELAKAKSGLLQHRQQNRSNDAVVAGGWNSYLFEKRSWAFSQEMDDKIKALTLDQVNDAFRRRIDPTKLSVFVAYDAAKAKAKAAAGSK